MLGCKPAHSEGHRNQPADLSSLERDSSPGLSETELLQPVVPPCYLLTSPHSLWLPLVTWLLALPLDLWLIFFK